MTEKKVDRYLLRKRADKLGLKVVEGGKKISCPRYDLCDGSLNDSCKNGPDYTDCPIYRLIVKHGEDIFASNETSPEEERRIMFGEFEKCDYFMDCEGTHDGCFDASIATGCDFYKIHKEEDLK